MKLKGKKLPLLPILAFAVLVTSLLASGTLAKYTSSFSASATAQIAAFAGGGTMDFEVPLENMKPSDVKQVQFSVQNYDDSKNCQVQMDYDIQVKTTGNLPLSFALRGRKNSWDESPDSKVTGALDENLLATGGKLPPVETNEDKRTHSYELQITWEDEESDSDYSQEIDMVTVTVTAVQVNPNGEQAAE